jgi:hypothetical protein
VYGVVPEVLPGVAQLEQHTVSDGLARQAGASCAEGHWDAMRLGDGQQLLDLSLVVDLQRQPRLLQSRKLERGSDEV